MSGGAAPPADPDSNSALGDNSALDIGGGGGTETEGADSNGGGGGGTEIAGADRGGGGGTGLTVGG